MEDDATQSYVEVTSVDEKRIVSLLPGKHTKIIDLTDGQFQNLSLRESSFSFARLVATNFYGADLSKSSFVHANANRAIFRKAKLSSAYFWNTSLTWTDFSDADLSAAHLLGAEIRASDMTNANLTGAMIGGTLFANCPTLGAAKGLDSILHTGPAILDNQTLRACIHQLPNSFLEGCGYTQHEIGYLRALYRDSPIAMYSCFISHAEANLLFASRLLADLRQANVNCWHYKDSLKGGQDWQPQIDEAIKMQDKLILVCSRQSVYRENVVKEILRAIEVERQTGEQKLFPIMLDHHILGPEMMEEAREMVTTRVWRENWVLHIKRKHIPDFSGWDNDNAKYVQEFNNLLRDLRRSS